MAQKTGQERTNTNTSTNTTDKAASPAGGMMTTMTTMSNRLISGASSFFMPSRVNRPQAANAANGANGAARPAQKGVWRRILIGMFVFIVAAQVFEYLLLFVDQKFFNLSLEKHAIASASVPLLGGMNQFTFIYLLFILLLYIGLLRFNVLPSGKDLRNQRAQATTATTSTASSTASRSARKRAARQSSATATHSTTTTSRVKSGQAGGHDDAYDRVKAAQRQRRRRDARR